MGPIKVTKVHTLPLPDALCPGKAQAQWGKGESPAKSRTSQGLGILKDGEQNRQ